MTHGVFSERFKGVMPVVGSTRLHEGAGFHVLGREYYTAGYYAVEDEKEPTLAGFRPIHDSNILTSRVHGILAPHPKEKGKFIYVHLGKNKPRIEKK